MTQEVFKVDDQSTVQQDTDEVVAALVGEGKKYKTITDLAKAYMNIDEFVETLKAENHELKEKVTKASTIDEVMERLSSQSKAGVSDPSTVTQSTGGVSADEIQKLVEKTVTGLETSKTRTENLKKANALLAEAFGDKAGEVFKDVASTPELENVYRELAQVAPEKFIQHFLNVPKNTGVQPDTSGSVSATTTGTSVRVSQPGTKEYYDNVRKTNKALYYSQEFQVGMDKAVRSNPDLYYGKA